MINMNEVVSGVTLTERRKVSADDESKKAGIFKQVDLAICYDGLLLKDVFAKAYAHDVISWQTQARNNYNSLVDKSTVKISAKSPGKTSVDPETAMVDKLRACNTDEEREAVLAELLAKARAKV